MRPNKIPGIFTILAMAVTLAIGGCRSKTASNNPPSSTPSPGASSQAAANNPPAPPPDQSAGAQPAQSQPAAGQSGAAEPAQGQPAQSQAPQTPPPPAQVVIPAGTRVRVRLDEDLGSKISQTGQTFDATVADDVVADGQTIIPRGARAEGTVIDAKPLGRFKGGAVLELRLERVRTNWGSYPVATSTMERVEKGKGRRTGLFAGGGAGLGALVGGLAGGGKGALIGGLAGAGAGTAGSAMTGNKEIFLPAETLITFRLEHGVHVTEQQ